MSDQDNREKVIKGLECVIDKTNFDFKYCHSCEYRKDIDHFQYVCDADRCIADAIALLKAQEPRVMTLDDKIGNRHMFSGESVGGFIREAPTIAAIPVEWLEEHDSEGNEYGRRYITVVEALSMWQQEQEAQQ